MFLKGRPPGFRRGYTLSFAHETTRQVGSFPKERVLPTAAWVRATQPLNPPSLASRRSTLAVPQLHDRFRRSRLWMRGPHSMLNLLKHAQAFSSAHNHAWMNSRGRRGATVPVPGSSTVAGAVPVGPSVGGTIRLGVIYDSEETQ